MALSWNEIKTRAAQFVINWKDKASTAREEADAQTFENEFFYIFGVERSQVAIFEHKVKLLSESRGYIDLFWKGHILIEMKTPGKDMDDAYRQAKDYANALPPVELPKGILICDFVRFHYYDLKDNAKKYEFSITELVENIELFNDLAGYKDVEFKKQEQVNIEAAERMGKLHDRLKEIGYEGHQLEVYLVRLLFCLFADDTGIFEHDHFYKYIANRTSVDGSDLALHIQSIFDILNKPEDKRLKTIDEQLAKFPYVNGGLFEERLETAAFDSSMRDALLYCCQLDWSKISPAIFGAMFQSVMNPKERRALGAHYTSEENIMKLIHPLFLDDLWEEFDEVKKTPDFKDVKRQESFRKEKLNKFHDKLAKLKFLDPACGCGNFLVITYRELRILEMAVIKEVIGSEIGLDIDMHVKVNVNQFYGIEIEEFPKQIAQVAMWLMDHQMNMLIRNMFGQYFIRIPLRESVAIECANALTIDWGTIVSKEELSFILGNPPFLGARMMDENQKNDLEAVFANVKNKGNLDFVTCWYLKSAQFIQGTNIEFAFVSTNSICQGEQVPILWPELLIKYNLKINFAHQTFKWSNEAKGKAAVFCVIVGLSCNDRKCKKVFIYTNVNSNPMEVNVRNINAYLIDGPMVFIDSRSKPICRVPILSLGSQPIDGGNYLFKELEMKDFLDKEPASRPYFRKWIGSDEYINGYYRYFLFLKNCPPDKLRNLPESRKRIECVREFRMNSTRAVTRKLAETPTLFAFENIPTNNYVVIPEVSSERRKYIPIGFLPPEILPSNLVKIITAGEIFHFGVLTSSMHMAWVRYICGRLKSDYRYSGSIVYNNFPWPAPTDAQKIAIEEAAQIVLDTRSKYPDSSLADLYDPDLMPPDLVKAHQRLDSLVEKAYGKKFETDADRVAHLFELYQKLTAGLFVEEKPTRKKKSAET